MISLIALTVKKQEGSTADDKKESPRRFVRQAQLDNGFAFSATDKTRQLPSEHLKSRFCCDSIYILLPPN